MTILKRFFILGAPCILALGIAVGLFGIGANQNQAEAQLLGDISALELRTVSALPNIANDGSIDIRFEMIFTTNPPSYAELQITITPSDGTLAIRTKKTDAIQAYASGAGLTIPRTRIILFEMGRGL